MKNFCFLLKRIREHLLLTHATLTASQFRTASIAITNRSGGRVDGTSASKAVGPGLIPSRIKAITLKLFFYIFLFQAT